MRALVLFLLAGALTGPPAASAAAEASPSVARAASVCADYENQAAAQAAADTTDANGDGVYCSSLPCPCAGPGENGAEPDAPSKPAPKKCSRPTAVQELVFSKAKYPNIRAHFLTAVKQGWPQILVINRPHADDRRDRLLKGIETRDGFDRDEYPPAVGRGAGRKALMRGTDPTGWKAHVDYVESSENQSHGSTMGAKLRRFCNGTRFRYRFG